MDARLRKKVCFWYNGTSGEIRMGLPEEYPAIRGFEKIVCSTAHEAEIWSERMRRWELLKMHGGRTTRDDRRAHARRVAQPHSPLDGQRPQQHEPGVPAQASRTVRQAHRQNSIQTDQLSTQRSIRAWT